jgi:hypothetical protein
VSDADTYNHDLCLLPQQHYEARLLNRTLESAIRIYAIIDVRADAFLDLIRLKQTKESQALGLGDVL